MCVHKTSAHSHVALKKLAKLSHKLIFFVAFLVEPLLTLIFPLECVHYLNTKQLLVVI